MLLSIHIHIYSVLVKRKTTRESIATNAELIYISYRSVVVSLQLWSMSKRENMLASFRCHSCTWLSKIWIFIIDITYLRLLYALPLAIFKTFNQLDIHNDLHIVQFGQMHLEKKPLRHLLNIFFGCLMSNIYVCGVISSISTFTCISCII